MNKQEFIIQELKPYFLDRSICGINVGGTGCVNRNEKGNMCVFGKNLTEPYNHEGQAYSPADINLYGEFILKPESRGMLSVDEWYQMRRIHDTWAIGGVNTPEDLLKTLEASAGVDLTELKELVK